MRKVSSIVNKIFPSVMQHHVLWVVFVAYFSVFNNCETRQQQQDGIPYIVSRLFRNKNKPPIILYLDPKQDDRFIEQHPQHLRQNDGSIEQNPEDLRQHYRSFEENQENLRDDDEEDDSNENLLRTTQYDERAYLLYHLLKSTIEEENIDPEIVQRLQPAQEYLRTAFIGRCRKLDKCMKRCPRPKKKYACTMQCKQIFDDLDQCDEPKQNPCESQKCGNTMPPTWLL